MNGDHVRTVRFYSGEYDAWKVDDLLRRVAAELDAGRPVGSLINNAQFRRAGHLTGKGYDVDAVDWFLDQILLPPSHSKLAGNGEDPWRDLGEVTRLTLSGVSGTAKHSAGRAWLASKEHFSKECEKAWRHFEVAPGTHLLWGQVNTAGSRELRTPEEQTIASLRRYGPFRTASTGGRTFTFKRIRPAKSSPPGFAEIVARSGRDYDGHFAENSHSWIVRNDPGIGPKHRVRGLVDKTGTPILYTSGRNFAFRAWASITFPDQRWLRFLVRGTEDRNAIMTAVDQAGNRAIRYRIISSRYFTGDTMEITVHPDWKLIDELALAIVISAHWLHEYFWTGG